MTNPMRPVGDRQPHALCGAKTRDGDPCRNAPMTGQLRCRMHGGASLQARAAAERRLAVAEAAKAVERWGGRTDIAPAMALLELVQAKATEVAYWDRLVAGLSAENRPGSTALQQLHRSQDQLAAYASAALKAGADEAMVRVATMQAQWLVPWVRQVVALARAQPDQPADQIVRRALEAVDAPEGTRDAIASTTANDSELHVSILQDAMLRIFQRVGLTEEQWRIVPGIVVEELEAITTQSTTS